MNNLNINPRPSKMVSIRIPLDTLEQLKQVAIDRDLGYQSLLKLYIGEGLHRDVAELHKDSLLNKTENLLRKHLDDDKKIPSTESQVRLDTEVKNSENLLGLCKNCEKRKTCTIPKPEGGVWRCEEYS